MEPRIHVITLAVDDLERALAFYRDGLGLSTKGIVADEHVGSETEAAGAIVIFELAGGLLLTLYPRTELAKDAHIPPSPPASGEFSIGHIVSERADVDALLSGRERRAQRPRTSLASVLGGSIRATFVIPTATSGRSSGTPAAAEAQASAAAMTSPRLRSVSPARSGLTCSRIQVPPASRASRSASAADRNSRIRIRCFSSTFATRAATAPPSTAS